MKALRLLSILALCPVASGLCPGASAQVIYVDDSAAGANDGSSWQDAFTDLQSALVVADTTDQVWVARGTYKPSATLDRHSSFVVSSFVYGGFDGTEVSLADRAGLFDETILSGDLLGNDGPGFAGNGENSVHVVLADSEFLRTVILDGFTVQGGNAGLDAGGGLFVDWWGFDVTIRNCTFARNFANRGGAISCADKSIVQIERCTFWGNGARLLGGGVSGGMNTQVLSCLFVGNRAGRFGGGLDQAWRAFDCVFSGNVAGEEGGGACGTPNVTNCTFSGNTAAIGGGIMARGYGSPDELLNCVLWGNQDGTGSTQSGQVAGPVAGDIAADDSVVQGWDGSLPGAGTIDADPLFRSPLGADGIAGTLDDDLRLELGSPCVDSARASSHIGLQVDALGLPRFVDSLGCDGGGILDRGALERQDVDGTTVFCASTPSSLGFRAEIGGPCTAGPVGGAFTITARPVPDGRAFLLLGDPGAPLPFGDGNLCLTGILHRTSPVVPSDGTAAFLVDPSVPPASDVLHAGASVGLQILFRDASAGGAGFNLSPAMRLLVLP